MHQLRLNANTSSFLLFTVNLYTVYYHGMSGEELECCKGISSVMSFFLSFSVPSTNQSVYRYFCLVK